MLPPPMIAILAMSESIADGTARRCYWAAYRAAGHHRQLARLRHDAARLVDDEVVLVEPVLPDLDAAADHSQPAIGGQSPKERGQLDGGRPAGAFHREGHRRRHIAAHQREQRVRGDTARARPHLDHRRAPVCAGPQRRQHRPDVAPFAQVHQAGQRVARLDRRDVAGRFGWHQIQDRVRRQQRHSPVLGLTEVDDGVHRGAVALGQLDIDHADSAAALADQRRQQHRPRVRRPQKAGRHGNRLRALSWPTAARGARGVGTQRQHRAAVHLGPDGPVLVQLALQKCVGTRRGRPRAASSLR